MPNLINSFAKFPQSATLSGSRAEEIGFHHFILILSSQSALRGLGLLLADGALTVGRGKIFWRVNCFFFTKMAVTRERKVEKLLPRWEMNGLSEATRFWAKKKALTFEN